MNRRKEAIGTECNVCDRLHDEDQPCPRRVANAYTMRPQALEQLTEVDKQWMATHEVNLADILEEELANGM